MTAADAAARASRIEPAPRPVRPSRRLDRSGFGAPRRPSASTAWLHLVSGSTPARAAQAACTVAADLLAGGGRVLLADAGRRCVLHARFGRESRWGVGECLARTLPVLGVVQPTGIARLHLLARGGEPRLLWEAFGRFADDAHAHYDHVLVALDPDTPREAGMAILGRLVEAWWAGDDLATRAAMGLSERLGIAFSALPMELEAEVSLEGMRDPAAAAAEPRPRTSRRPDFEPGGWLGLELPAAVAAVPERLAPALAVAEDLGERVAAALGGTRPEPGRETLVIACDEDVRARLEFLMWVRGMAGATPATGPAWTLAGPRA